MSTSTVMLSTSLYFRDGRSDKVYHVTLESCDNSYTVNCAWGRRGASLQTTSFGTITLGRAKEIYSNKVKEKRDKGYQLSPSSNNSIPVVNTSNPLLPLCNLLNPVDADTVDSLMRDEQWVMQEKMDGVRLLIHKEGENIAGYSRTGRQVAVPNNIVEALRLTIMNDTFIIDGELVGDVYYAFDLLETDQSWRNTSYLSRWKHLAAILSSQSYPCVVCLNYIVKAQEKFNEFHTIKKCGGEGVVFKHINAHYEVGRPASGGDYLKFKFYKTCSAIVTTINEKRSVGLSCYACPGILVSVGNCTIPPNHPVPELESVVEVRYLYARLPSHALFQPTYLGVRLDVGTWECGLSQLKYKVGEGEQEDDG